MQNALKRFGEKDIGLLSGRFSTARIKLTLMYVAILAVILTLSSGSIYSAFSSRLERRFERFRPRAPLVLPDGVISPSTDEVRSDLIYSLFLVNGILLFAGGAFSYFLAGITLVPIQEAYQRQRRFLSNASHELRTPLAILQTDIENELRAENISSLAREQRESNLEEVKRMGHLVNDILILSRYDEGLMPAPVLLPVDCILVLQSLIKRLQGVAVSRQVGLVMDESSPASVLVLANEALLQQSLLNLLQNAIAYNVVQGTVRVLVVSHNEKVRIVIRDTGIGISKQDVERLTERFYRVDASRSRQTGGSGLGLAIVRAHIESMGGLIELMSELGKGTEVVVCLGAVASS